jgi:di/tricarboxylate transporter
MFILIFTSLYESILGTHSDYSQEFSDDIFPAVGFITFVIAIVFCLLFYVALGRWKNIWYTTVHWAITIALVAAVGFGLAFSQTKSAIDIFDNYVLLFGLYNALFAAIIFIAFSFLFKNFSIFAKRTPF